MTTKANDHFETLAIHAGQHPDPTTGAVMTPVYLTSTYAQSGPGEHKGFEYSRTRNPTRDALQGCLAALENGKHALAFASGLAATDAVLHLLSAGDHVVLSDDLYGGTFRLADKVFKRLGIEQTYVDVTDARAVEGAFRPNTKLLWVETPTNPMLKICDLAALADVSRKRKVISVCDNTFATPYFQRPLELGIDVVAHSMTKYLNGHSDVVAGALVLRRDDLHEKLAFLQNAVGAVPGPLDSFLVLRGLKTLHVRMERHDQNARLVVEALKRHPKVERVIWPGLAEHPQHVVEPLGHRGRLGRVRVGRGDCQARAVGALRHRRRHRDHLPAAALQPALRLDHVGRLARRDHQQHLPEVVAVVEPREPARLGRPHEAVEGAEGDVLLVGRAARPAAEVAAGQPDEPASDSS